MIEVQLLPKKGRGVVATKLIPKGALIEKAPVASIPAEQQVSLEATEVFQYYFVRLSEYEKNKEVGCHIVFGLSSLCNHSETPNTYVNWVEDEIGLWAYLIALEDIQLGEECLLFYTNVDQYPSQGYFIL